MTDVVFDLDGVLADYSGGWAHHSEFPGEMLPGTSEHLLRLKRAGYRIGISSTRQTTIIKKWVSDYGLDDLIDWININPFNPPDTSSKPIGSHYIDDRAIRFENNLSEIVDSIISERIRPWQE